MRNMIEKRKYHPSVHKACGPQWCGGCSGMRPAQPISGPNENDVMGAGVDAIVVPQQVAVG